MRGKLVLTCVSVCLDAKCSLGINSWFKTNYARPPAHTLARAYARTAPRTTEILQEK